MNNQRQWPPIRYINTGPNEVTVRIGKKEVVCYVFPQELADEIQRINEEKAKESRRRGWCARQLRRMRGW